MLPLARTLVRGGLRFGGRSLSLLRYAGLLARTTNSIGGSSPPQVSIQLRGAERVIQEVNQLHDKAGRAIQVAVRREAFLLRNKLKREIKTGAPGGSQFDGLTRMARRRRGRGSWLPDQPLARLANPIRYDVLSKNPLAISVGWTENTPKSVRRIVERQQKGFTSPVTNLRERYFRHRGSELPKRSQFRRYFFLRKSTTRFTTPARPVIDPFWNAERDSAISNIRRNFRAKMAGRRI